MKSSRLVRHAQYGWLLAAALACQDRILNFLPNSEQPAAGSGSVGVFGGGGSVGGTPFTAGSSSAGQPTTGGIAGTAAVGGDSVSSGGSVSAGGGSSGGSVNAGGGSSGGEVSGGAGRAGSNAGSAGSAGKGGTPCQIDAQCAAPTPACNPTLHVCRTCNQNVPCLNGRVCETEGECG